MKQYSNTSLRYFGTTLAAVTDEQYLDALTTLNNDALKTDNERLIVHMQTLRALFFVEVRIKDLRENLFVWGCVGTVVGSAVLLLLAAHVVRHW
jgi:hypothetical protein